MGAAGTSAQHTQTTRASSNGRQSAGGVLIQGLRTLGALSVLTLANHRGRSLLTLPKPVFSSIKWRV